MQRVANAYLETQVTTTSPGQVLLMLYDGALNFLAQAKERMAAKDYAGKGNLISKALDILNELSSSLNSEKGGDLADNLHQLYFYCSKRLFAANAKMDLAGVDEVVKILGGLRDAFSQIQDMPEAAAASAQIVGSRGNAAAGYAPPVPAGPGQVTSSPLRGAAAYGRQHTNAGPAGTDQAAAPVAENVVPAQMDLRTGALPPGRPSEGPSGGPVVRETAGGKPHRAEPGAEHDVVPMLEDDMPGVPGFDNAAAPPAMLGGKRLNAGLYRKFIH